MSHDRLTQRLLVTIGTRRTFPPNRHVARDEIGNGNWNADVKAHCKVVYKVTMS